MAKLFVASTYSDLPTMVPDVVEYVYMDGSVVREPIIGIGGTGIVVRREKHAVKLPQLAIIIESGGVPVEPRSLTPEEGDYDERAALSRIIETEKAIYRRLGDHPGVIKCYNAFSNDCSIEMPLMDGDLRRYVEELDEEEEKRMTRELQLSWLKKLAHTMAYIHSKRVLIADFRLANVLYDHHTMDVKYVDFSESSLMPLDWDLEGCDTGGYSIQTDIGQFGAAMFYLITRQHCAFDIYEEWKDVGDPTTWPRRENLPSTSGIWLGSIIERCWTKGFASSEHLAAALDEQST